MIVASRRESLVALVPSGADRLAARDDAVAITGAPVEVVDTIGAGDAFTAAPRREGCIEVCTASRFQMRGRSSRGRGLRAWWPAGPASGAVTVHVLHRHRAPGAPGPRHRRYIAIADRDDLGYGDKLAACRALTDEHFESDRYHDFCDSRLAHFDELVLDWVSSGDFDRLLVDTIRSTYPAHEHERFVGTPRGLVAQWVREQGAEPAWAAPMSEAHGAARQSRQCSRVNVPV